MLDEVYHELDSKIEFLQEKTGRSQVIECTNLLTIKEYLKANL